EEEGEEVLINEDVVTQFTQRFMSQKHRTDDETAENLEWMAEEDEDEERQRRGGEEWSYNPMAVDRDEGLREQAGVVSDGPQEEDAREEGREELGAAIYDVPPSSPFRPSPEKRGDWRSGQRAGTPTRGGRGVDGGGPAFSSPSSSQRTPYSLLTQRRFVLPKTATPSGSNVTSSQNNSQQGVTPVLTQNTRWIIPRTPTRNTPSDVVGEGSRNTTPRVKLFPVASPLPFPLPSSSLPPGSSSPPDGDSKSPTSHFGTPLGSQSSLSNSSPSRRPPVIFPDDDDDELVEDQEGGPSSPTRSPPGPSWRIPQVDGAGDLPEMPAPKRRKVRFDDGGGLWDFEDVPGNGGGSGSGLRRQREWFGGESGESSRDSSPSKRSTDAALAGYRRAKEFRHVDDSTDSALRRVSSGRVAKVGSGTKPLGTFEGVEVESRRDRIVVDVGTPSKSKGFRIVGGGNSPRKQPEWERTAGYFEKWGRVEGEAEGRNESFVEKLRRESGDAATKDGVADKSVGVRKQRAVQEDAVNDAYVIDSDPWSSNDSPITMPSDTPTAASLQATPLDIPNVQCISIPRPRTTDRGHKRVSAPLPQRKRSDRDSSASETATLSEPQPVNIPTVEIPPELLEPVVVEGPPKKPPNRLGIFPKFRFRSPAPKSVEDLDGPAPIAVEDDDVPLPEPVENHDVASVDGDDDSEISSPVYVPGGAGFVVPSSPVLGRERVEDEEGM
ncbi:hypothetical protein HK097_005464, partial [Rhizophlyctis rosea]